MSCALFLRAHTAAAATVIPRMVACVVASVMGKLTFLVRKCRSRYGLMPKTRLNPSRSAIRTSLSFGMIAKVKARPGAIIAAKMSTVPHMIAPGSMYRK